MRKAWGACETRTSVHQSSEESCQRRPYQSPGALAFTQGTCQAHPGRHRKPGVLDERVVRAVRGSVLTALGAGKQPKRVRSARQAHLYPQRSWRPGASVQAIQIQEHWQIGSTRGHLHLWVSQSRSRQTGYSRQLIQLSSARSHFHCLWTGRRWTSSEQRKATPSTQRCGKAWRCW
jgi:hypothetical protein